jgi:CubicO group peptidase (beta-lactamase class C family)
MNHFFSLLILTQFISNIEPRVAYGNNPEAAQYALAETYLAYGQPAVHLPPDSTLKALMQKHKVPALGIGVIENENLKTTKVLGELKSGVPAPVNTIFQVASLTKPIVEMTTLRLVSKGLWSLDEPLCHFWIDPDVKNDPRNKLVTTRHVLAHQTGFVNWRWLHSTGKLAFDFEPVLNTLSMHWR